MVEMEADLVGLKEKEAKHCGGEEERGCRVRSDRVGRAREAAEVDIVAETEVYETDKIRSRRREEKRE